MEMLGRAKAIISNFIKAIELLRLKFAFFKRRKKYALSISAVLILVAIGLVIPQGPAAAGLIDFIGTGLLSFAYLIVYYIFFVLFGIAYLVAWIGAGFLNINLNPAIINTVLDQSSPTSPLYQAWTIFRDIANLFFILVLLFIAIGTIVRSQSYNLKNLLPKLIIAVFLINFSNVIAGVIIDFGNIFMYGVLKWMSCPGNNECFSSFFSGLMTVVDDLYGTYKLGDGFTASAAATVGIVVATIYVFLYGLILLALGIFLLIRIAVLALLIILSPLAFVGEVFPGLKEISSEWWDKLIKYVMFGPIFALLLYVSGLMAQQKISVYAPSFFSSNPELGTFGTLYVTIIQNIIPLIFLLAIIPITQKLGIAGANAVFSSVGGLAKSVGASAFGHIDRFMARGASTKGDSKYAKVRRGLSKLSYGAYQRAGKAHEADRERDYDVATGAARDRIEKATLGDTKTNYEERAKKAKAELEFKAQGITNVNDMIDETQNAIEKGISPELLIKDLNFIAAEDGIDDFLDRTVDKSTNKVYGRGAKALSKYLHDTFGKDGIGYKNLDEKGLSKTADNIHNLEKKNGNVGYAGIGTSRYDSGSQKTKYDFNPMTSTADLKAQEDEQVKIGNKMDPKDLKKSSFINEMNNVSNAGERILADMKGKRAERIKMMDRDRVVEIDKALTKTYSGGPSALSGAQADLKAAWQKLKDDHNLPGAAAGGTGVEASGAGGPGGGPTYSGTATAGGSSGRVNTP